MIPCLTFRERVKETLFPSFQGGGVFVKVNKKFVIYLLAEGFMRLTIPFFRAILWELFSMKATDTAFFAVYCQIQCKVFNSKSNFF